MATDVAEPLLIERYTIRGGDFEHGGRAATQIKSIMRQLGIDPEIMRRLSIANFEAEMNLVMYADEGVMEFQVHPDAVRVVVADRGPGIPDIEMAMQEGWSTATPEMRARGFGAGLGLPNMKRNSDEFEIESAVGTGTTVRYAVYLR